VCGQERGGGRAGGAVRGAGRVRDRRGAPGVCDGGDLRHRAHLEGPDHPACGGQLRPPPGRVPGVPRPAPADLPEDRRLRPLRPRGPRLHLGEDRQGRHPPRRRRPRRTRSRGRMTVTVVGSIAFDAVKTPFGERERLLGGAATHFALAASFLDQVRVVGPVGCDFGPEDFAVLRTRGTNTDDVRQVIDGKTFFWRGEYGWDLNSRETLDTQLNVFADFRPELSAAARESEVVFLANIQP